jgi:hypothetical protein
MPTSSANDPATRRIAMVVWAAIAAVTIGCNEDTPVRQAIGGRVMVGTDDAVNGAIMFYPAGGQSGPASGTKVENGIYQFDASAGPLPGDYRVVLTLDNGDADPIEQDEPSPIAGKADLIASSEPVAKTKPAARSTGQHQTRLTVTAEGSQTLDVTFPTK